MTRTEFIEVIRQVADDLEAGSFHIADLGENKLFCNKNYGQIWVKVNKDCSINVDLYSATDEEKEMFKE